MSKHLRLALGAILLTTILYGQKITKEEIAKFKIKSLKQIANQDLVATRDECLAELGQQ
jgi:hypothetical protein